MEEQFSEKQKLEEKLKKWKESDIGTKEADLDEILMLLEKKMSSEANVSSTEPKNSKDMPIPDGLPSVKKNREVPKGLKSKFESWCKWMNAANALNKLVTNHSILKNLKTEQERLFTNFGLDEDGNEVEDSGDNSNNIFCSYFGLMQNERVLFDLALMGKLDQNQEIQLFKLAKGNYDAFENLYMENASKEAQKFMSAIEKRPVGIIVATAPENEHGLGIGCDKTITWRCPGDMNFFSKTTKEPVKLKVDTKKVLDNWCIMGWTTALSIPPKFFPFGQSEDDNRHVVVMTSKKEDPLMTEWKKKGKISFASDYEDLFKQISANAFKIGKIWICGGSKLYDDFIQTGSVLNGKLWVSEIYQTEIDVENPKCDTFIKSIPKNIYQREAKPLLTFEKNPEKKWVGGAVYKWKLKQK
jgi:dihydrofolate reductase